MANTSIDWNLRNVDVARGPRHFPGLDGLRGIAVLMVMGCHSGYMWMRGGFVGVDIFFVLSGFLITGIVLGQLTAGKFTFRSFYKRRAARILPALLLLLAVFSAMEWFLPQFMWPGRKFWPGVRHGLTFTMNFFNASGGVRTPFVHLWSLAAEAQFYLAMPLFIVAAWRLRALRFFFALSAVMVLAWFVFRGWVFVGKHFSVAPVLNQIALNRIEAFLLGGLLAYLLRLFSKIPSALSGFALVAPVALAAVFLSRDEQRGVGLGCTIAMLATGAIIIASIKRPGHIVIRALEWKPLRWTGDISYGLYLWHVPLYALFKQKGEMTPSVIAVSVAASFAAASASYYLLERRFLSRKT